MKFIVSQTCCCFKIKIWQQNWQHIRCIRANQLGNIQSALSATTIFFSYLISLYISLDSPNGASLVSQLKWAASLHCTDDRCKFAFLDQLSLVTPGARATVLPFVSLATSSDEEHHQHKHCKHYALCQWGQRKWFYSWTFNVSQSHWRRCLWAAAVWPQLDLLHL